MSADDADYLFPNLVYSDGIFYRLTEDIDEDSGDPIYDPVWPEDGVSKRWSELSDPHEAELRVKPVNYGRT